MTGELLEQREQLVQSERVAAWRELARRLAHELKNPLFPLQLTVENLLRARQQSPEQFDEVFRESSDTLLAEISNLKNIISRFSEFSRMPQPQFQRVHLNEIVQNVARLLQAQLQSPEHPTVECRLELAEALPPLAADPELLHRAFSNLALNALDAMPAWRRAHTAHATKWRQGGSGNCRHRHRPDRRRMRSPVHALLHQQSTRHRTWIGHRSVDRQRPWRQDQRAQQAGTWNNVYDRTAGQSGQTVRAGLRSHRGPESASADRR